MPWFPSQPGIITFDALRQVDLDALAVQMLRHLPDNLVIGLVGTLGAGKTRLVQAIAAAAEVDQADVTSPTFTLLQTYQGRRQNAPLTIHHLDAYRIEEEDEFLELGVDELFDQSAAWTLVEWADRFHTAMPRETLWMLLSLTHHPEKRRVQMLRPAGDSAPIRRLSEAFLADRPASDPQS